MPGCTPSPVRVPPGMGRLRGSHPGDGARSPATGAALPQRGPGVSAGHSGKGRPRVEAQEHGGTREFPVHAVRSHLRAGASPAVRTEHPGYCRGCFRGDPPVPCPTPVCAFPVAKRGRFFSVSGRNTPGTRRWLPETGIFALGEARESLCIFNCRGFCYSSASIIIVWGRFSYLKNNGEGTSGCVFLPWKQICLQEF